MTSRYLAVIALAAQFCACAASAPVPADDAVSQADAGPAMDYLEAYQTMDAHARRALKQGAHCARDNMSKMFESLTAYKLDRAGLALRCRMTTGVFSMGEGTLHFVFARTPRPEIIEKSDGLWLVANEESAGKMNILGLAPGETAQAERFAAAWRALANPPAEEPLDLSGTAPLAELPEEVQRFKVEAEMAVREKHFFDAAIAYRKGLALAPGWVAGRFNSALVLAESGFYREAAAEMKRYLSLRPDAANARLAQNHIYEWEAKARR